MKIPLKFLERKNPSEYFLSLILRNEKVTSIVFEKLGNNIKHVGSDEEYFKNTIEDADNEEFLNVLDKVITSAESALPENTETHKTLFGLKESWIEGDKIKKEYLDKLKKASDELSLEPIGFLAYTESVINLIQKEEGAPITAVLADIGKKYITVSLIKAGKILETKSSEIHQSASYTVDTLLKHFQSPEVMPARIIVLDSEEDELTQEFINHSWSKSLPFLHLPQILSLPEDASIKAMLLGAATKMGGSILYDQSKNLEEQKPSKIENEDAKEEKQADKAAQEPKEKESPSTKEEEKVKVDYVGDEVSMEYFGFVEGQDIAKTPAVEKKIEVEENLTNENIEEKIDEIPEEVKAEEEKKNPFPVNIALTFSKIKSFLPKILGAMGKIKLNKNLLKKISSNKKILISVGIILITFISFLSIYALGTTANVNILVAAKEDQKDAPVTFSLLSSTNIKNSVISSGNISVSEEGSVTIKTTGKKDVGDKAKGAVTVFNNANSNITFSQGTKITSSNNLVFTIDSSITVASASGDIFSGTKPGIINVNITAGEIGQEYNLPSGTKFSIGSNSNVAAKNDNAFSGGTKKSITIVSKDDISKLQEELPKSLENKAKENIKSKITSGQQALASFIDKTIESKNFDKKEGDQAQAVTLKGTVNFTTVSFSNKDIEDFASLLFNSSENQVSAKNLVITAKNIGIEKNKDITADVTIKAKIFPKIDTSSLAKEIAGNSLQKANNIILNISQVSNTEILLSPNFPLLPKNLPRDPNKININVSSN